MAGERDFAYGGLIMDWWKNSERCSVYSRRKYDE